MMNDRLQQTSVWPIQTFVNYAAIEPVTHVSTTVTTGLTRIQYTYYYSFQTLITSKHVLKVGVTFIACYTITR